MLRVVRLGLLLGSLPQSQTSGWGFCLAGLAGRKPRRQRQLGQAVTRYSLSPVRPIQLNPPPPEVPLGPALSDSRRSPGKRVNRHVRGGRDGPTLPFSVLRPSKRTVAAGQTGRRPPPCRSLGEAVLSYQWEIEKITQFVRIFLYIDISYQNPARTPQLKACVLCPAKDFRNTMWIY